MKYKPYRFFIYLLLQLSMFLVRLVPRNLALTLARFLGSFTYVILTRQRGRTLENLHFVFGKTKTEKEIKKIAREVFKNLAQVLVDVILFPKLSAQNLHRIVDWGNELEKIKEIKKRGKGVIVLTGHIGNWELLAATFCLLGYEGKVVGRKIYYKRYNDLIIKTREKAKVYTIYRDSSPREILKVLRDNQVLGVVTDQDVDNIEGIFVDFLSQPAYTSTAPVKLALASGAPIVPGFMIRKKNGKYKMTLQETIIPNPSLNREEEIIRCTKAWSEAIEEYVQRYPEQWVWMHPRWKTKPETVLKNHEKVLKT